MRKLHTLVGILDWTLHNRKWAQASRQRLRIRELLTLANLDIGKLSYHDPIYPRRVHDFDRVYIELQKARWHWDRAMDTDAGADWDGAFDCFRRGIELAEQLYETVRAGSNVALEYAEPNVSDLDTEITWADGVPLEPEICPVVILQGSDFDMGFQYAQQVIQIFGRWILERKAGRSRRFSSDDLTCLHKWEDQVREHAPEILGLCQGWAAGASAMGVSLAYEDVLDLWTGHKPPSESAFGINDIGLPAELARPLCSGVAAWGRATRDGRLVTGSSGDHELMHMATVVAFPETGNNFIFVPFCVTGDIRNAVHMFMLGHPGMNNRGLAYVEHGGEPRVAEPAREWGYGIRKGTEIFHLLRFASSAKEALHLELSYPVGDVGRFMGSVGGFWADRSYGYVPERRTDPVVVREAGALGETDFMYALNGVMHPSMRDVWWMQTARDTWHWDPHGGWYAEPFTFFHRGMMGDAEKIRAVSLNMIQNLNRDRALAFYDLLQRGFGSIDLEFMKMVYRHGGTLPCGSWKEIVAAYKKTGRFGQVSPAGSTNAVVTVMRPDDGDTGVYSLCTGEARRGLAPFAPEQNPIIYGETNAFWELTLAGSPEGVASHARQKAQDHLEDARCAVAGMSAADPACAPLARLLEQARVELARGLSCEAAAQSASDNESLAAWARATRSFTRAQVRSLQVHHALFPPPNRPEDMNMR